MNLSKINYPGMTRDNFNPSICYSYSQTAKLFCELSLNLSKLSMHYYSELFVNA
jgi:hypothetical protein